MWLVHPGADHSSTGRKLMSTRLRSSATQFVIENRSLVLSIELNFALTTTEWFGWWSCVKLRNGYTCGSRAAPRYVVVPWKQSNRWTSYGWLSKRTTGRSYVARAFSTSSRVSWSHAASGAQLCDTESPCNLSHRSVHPTTRAKRRAANHSMRLDYGDAICGRYFAGCVRGGV